MRPYERNRSIYKVSSYLCAKITVARKETYRSKFLRTQGEQPAEQTVRPEIDPAVQQAYLEGKVLLIDKPLHWTSFDVVRRLRSLLRIKKIGHAGTLDPLASGLLIVCTGRFTKQINDFMAKEKSYTGHFVLGAVTPTYDLESTPEQLKPFEHLTRGQLEAATRPFTGSILQYPPVYSAIKKNGQALYELARRGEAVELEARPVTISHFAITHINLPEAGFEVTCSTGTYIRSLAHDYGQALGCGAYLGSLRRTAIGEMKVEDAITLEMLEAELKQANAAAKMRNSDQS